MSRTSRKAAPRLTARQVSELDNGRSRGLSGMGRSLAALDGLNFFLADHWPAPSSSSVVTIWLSLP
jgi:hypothetical protein